MKVIKKATNTIVAGCYTPCQQGSSGGNKQLEINE